MYAKRGGQYIADALKDAVIVVENKRVKTVLMQLRNDMESVETWMNACRRLSEGQLCFTYKSKKWMPF